MIQLNNWIWRLSPNCNKLSAKETKRSIDLECNVLNRDENGATRARDRSLEGREG